MRVAYREIVEAALHARVPANREVRLVSANIKGAAMHATNTESLISQFAGGSAIARSFSPAFDRHGRAYKTALGVISYVKSSRSTTCTQTGSLVLNGCP